MTDGRTDQRTDQGTTVLLELFRAAKKVDKLTLLIADHSWCKFTNRQRTPISENRIVFSICVRSVKSICHTLICDI